jgi:DNA-directed RNA polymerase subunit E'/Rpb7
MNNSDIFVKSLLSDKVKLLPSQLDKDIRKYILNVLQRKFEGVCSNHGYIRSKSLEIYKVSMGSVLAVSLNGYVEYKVQFYADVCNPTINSVVASKIVNVNKFGFLAHTGVKEDGGVFTPILEIILPRNTLPSNKEVTVGDEVWCEVVGKKYELGDHRICIVGKLVEKPGTTILDTVDDEIEGLIGVAVDADEVEPEESGEEESEGEKSDGEGEKETEEESEEESDAELEIGEDDFGVDEVSEDDTASDDD